jgi:hypothetical protein
LENAAGLGERKLGRWLGVSHRIGSQMTCYVLSSTGEAMSRTAMQQVTCQESQMTENKTLFQEFDAEIQHRLRNNDFP